MGPDDWPPVAVVVPDDIRELDADVADYQRELKRTRRRTRAQRLLLLRRWERYGFSGPIVVVLVLLVAFVGSLMALFPPSPQHRAKAAPLASPVVAPGKVGGLLPDVRLDVNGVPVQARALRPALLYVVPSGCACASLVRNLVRQTAQYSLPLVLLPDHASSKDVTALRDASLGRADVASDSSGALERAYSTDSLVFVRADGVVLTVTHHPTPQTRYELPLSQLATPASQTTALSNAA